NFNDAYPPNGGVRGLAWAHPNPVVFCLLPTCPRPRRPSPGPLLMRIRRVLLPAVVCATLLLSRAPEPPAAAAPPGATAAFRAEGVAFLNKHCLGCHGGAKPKADLALDKFADDASLLRDRKTWGRVLDTLRAGEMPPPAKPQPAAAERDSFVKLIDG